MPEEEVKLGDYRGFLKALRVDSEGNYVEPAAPSFTIATDMAPAPEAKYDQGLNLFTEDVDALRRSNQSSWDVVENAFQNAGATALMEIPIHGILAMVNNLTLNNPRTSIQKLDTTTLI